MNILNPIIIIMYNLSSIIYYYITNIVSGNNLGIGSISNYSGRLPDVAANTRLPVPATNVVVPLVLL